MFENLLAIGLGGALGAIARYGLSAFITHRFPEFAPSGTLAVNLLGCLLIGILWGAAGSEWLQNKNLELFLMTGFLGSLTTFSTFGYQTVQLLQEGKAIAAMSNVTANVVLGLLFVWIGFLGTSQIFPHVQPSHAQSSQEKISPSDSAIVDSVEQDSVGQDSVERNSVEQDGLKKKTDETT